MVRKRDQLLRYFFLFTDDQGEIFSAGADQIGNFLFKSGHASLDLDRNGRPYTVKLHVAALSAAGVERSVLEVSSGGQAVFAAPVSRIIVGMARLTPPAGCRGCPPPARRR